MTTRTSSLNRSSQDVKPDSAKCTLSQPVGMSSLIDLTASPEPADARQLRRSPRINPPAQAAPQTSLKALSLRHKLPNGAAGTLYYGRFPPDVCLAMTSFNGVVIKFLQEHGEFVNMLVPQAIESKLFLLGHNIPHPRANRLHIFLKPKVVADVFKSKLMTAGWDGATRNPLHDGDDGIVDSESVRSTALYCSTAFASLGAI